MKRVVLSVTLAVMAASPCLFAQRASTPFSMAAASPAATEGYTSGTLVRPAPGNGPSSMSPFSRLAFGAGISPMGINLQAAVYLNRRMNVRGLGNVFNYPVNNLSTNGVNVNGKLNFATAGTSVDIYP